MNFHYISQTPCKAWRDKNLWMASTETSQSYPTYQLRLLLLRRVCDHRKKFFGVEPLALQFNAPAKRQTNFLIPQQRPDYVELFIRTSFDIGSFLNGLHPEARDFCIQCLKCRTCH